MPKRDDREVSGCLRLSIKKRGGEREREIEREMKKKMLNNDTRKLSNKV